MSEHQTKMTPEMQDSLTRYLAARDQERIGAANRMCENLTERERLLVKEAAVMGFVLGNQARPESREEFPGDSEILTRVLTTVQNCSDLYPTLASLEGM